MKYWVERIIGNPALQAVSCLALILLFMLFDAATRPGPGDNADSQSNMPWVFVLAMTLFYALFNSIFGLKSQKPVRYFGHSIYSYVGLLVVGSLLAWLFSGLTIDEAGSFRWLYVVLTFGYIIFIVISRLMKQIVEIAMKQDDRLRGE